MTAALILQFVSEVTAGRRTSDDFLQAMRDSSQQPQALRLAMETAFAARDWSALQYLVLAAYWAPSKEHTIILSSILAELSEHMTNEDVADVLADIADERSLSALQKGMEADLDWDEFHALNVKCVWAMARIRTKAATALLEWAARCSPYEEIRWAASTALHKPPRDT
jgi:hypothetical protein